MGVGPMLAGGAHTRRGAARTGEWGDERWPLFGPCSAPLAHFFRYRMFANDAIYKLIFREISRQGVFVNRRPIKEANRSRPIRE